MAVELGIVGLANVGKSTLFNALSRGRAPVANYPFTTIEPNVGIVVVPDTRLEAIAAIIRPERVVPSTMRIVDIAGLIRGASQGEGLGNQFLGHIRTVDAIALVLRAFSDADTPHVMGELDPVRDAETVQLELVLADLETVHRRQEKTRDASKGRPAEYRAEMEALQHLEERLNRGEMARPSQLSEAEATLAREIGLLTAKPFLYILNVGEDNLDGGPLAEPLRERARVEGTEVVVICAQCEADLVDWPPDEALAYLRELGAEQSSLNALIDAGYRLLDQITFFTTTGGKEVRAWPILRGTTVIEAAGEIHSDMQRGFIRAEVVNYADLVQAGSMAAVRELGRMHVEGREYVVQDGDVIHIRFNV